MRGGVYVDGDAVVGFLGLPTDTTPAAEGVALGRPRVEGLAEDPDAAEVDTTGRGLSGFDSDAIGPSSSAWTSGVNAGCWGSWTPAAGSGTGRSRRAKAAPPPASNVSAAAAPARRRVLPERGASGPAGTVCTRVSRLVPTATARGLERTVRSPSTNSTAEPKRSCARTLVARSNQAASHRLPLHERTCAHDGIVGRTEPRVPVLRLRRWRSTPSRCAPASEDLAMDSVYRFSWATRHTQQERYAEVLAVLGDRTDVVPISGPLQSVVGFFRAHALERLRGPEPAAEELARVAAGHPHGWARIAELNQHNPELCPGALARTESRWWR
jgi:hypothetical protein